MSMMVMIKIMVTATIMIKVKVVRVICRMEPLEFLARMTYFIYCILVLYKLVELVVGEHYYCLFILCVLCANG